MERKIKWGILGVARIATRRVIPALQRSRFGQVLAIASRDQAKADSAAVALGIPRAYGSYEELLADPDVEAVYNALPNHLHVPWSQAALERGKHVLCEKPIALGVAEAEALLAVRDRSGKKVQEAFMVRTHPQWLGVRDLVRAGRIGRLRVVSCVFSYFSEDPGNVRHVPEYGGGGLLDIGCYPVTLSRFLFEAEPRRVMALVELDPRFGTDRLASAILDFPAGQCVFTCGTQLVPHQRVQVLGTTGRIEVEIPFSAPNDRSCRVFLDGGGDVFGTGVETLSYDVCDQYLVQGDLFARAILDDGEVSVPLEDSLRNTRVIEALFRSVGSARWEPP